MNFPRPFLALFVMLSMPKYAKHLTVEEVASAIGFVVFAVNECAKLFMLTRRKIKLASARRRKRRLRPVAA